ncbi:MAG: YiiX family permuted papain-like enzyme [Bacteroidales bacterium]
MKKTIIIFGLLGIVLLSSYYYKRKFYDPQLKINNARKEVKQLTENDIIKDADLIFQTSLSRQSKAIQLATKSKYSHCGLIFKENNEVYVYEAVQPVKRTLLKKWIAKGENGHYVIKRLKNANQILTSETLEKLKKNCEQFSGKNYDLCFEWSDEKIYCSELIWKVYQRATGIEIGKLQQLRNFDLSNDAVKAKMRERYGNNIPLNEIVISPSSIFESDQLETVKSNE